MSRHHAALSGRRWAWVRRKVLKRDGWRCRACGKYGNECDHIKPLQDGGAKYDESNLQCLCKRCHIAKTRAENRGPVDPERAAWQALEARMTGKRRGTGA